MHYICPPTSSIPTSSEAMFLYSEELSLKAYFRSASQELPLHSISARLNLILSSYQRLPPLELSSFKCW
jgi:hypothetical protein